MSRAFDEAEIRTAEGALEAALDRRETDVAWRVSLELLNAGSVSPS